MNKGIGLAAIFPAMMFVVTIGIPIIIIRYLICYCKRNKYLEKAKKAEHIVKGKKIASRHKYLHNINRSDIPDDGEKVTYEYEYKGKKYRKNIIYSWDVLNHEFPEEVELYFLKNPRKTATDEKELAENQVHFIGIIIITFIIGFIGYF